MPRRIAIVGGGMAGTAAAKKLAGDGAETVLFEGADGLGGRARSWHRPELEPDVGINLMFVSFYERMGALIREYGLENDLVELSTDVHITKNGRAVGLSSDSPVNLLRYPHASLRDRFAFLIASLREVSKKSELDLFDPLKTAHLDNGETAAGYGARVISPEGFDYLLRPQIEGFWNFASEEVSAVHARALVAWLGGAGFHVLRDGMEVIAERNAAGSEVRLRHEVTETAETGSGVLVRFTDATGAPGEEEFDAVVVATPAPVADRITAKLSAEAVPDATRAFLTTQRYEPALSVSYLVPRGTLPEQAHIVAGGRQDPPLRNMITYTRTRIDPDGGRRETLLLFTYPGRAVTRRLIGRPAEEQFAEVTPLLPTLWPDMPENVEPFHIAERPYGFPIPAPGRYRASASVIRSQRPPVVFCGDYFNSPTTEAALLSGERAAETLLDGLGRSRGPR
ncbi:FAD-dependent oxidoreductase [Nocardiopsis changdeensis]|uniref:FAD-dependent oxidoreductase n=1 Tax=Nocardiopsis changdeensis TaxID=2831969 RepID=A0ABX8BVL7_9ACTN|nr:MULTISPECIES: FAD-dependent oxidoreductase [Nocardiopsis]QUX25147.1 FAD-dependent oxidoreductase [Nocardiopsis changdeensis]QYX35534.1 FAD-dependent oxidoreductase [Nocardiopsis sp. MT53]